MRREKGRKRTSNEEGGKENREEAKAVKLRRGGEGEGKEWGTSD